MLGGIVMIEEQFVSFETAKLLKEAGFDVPCISQYMQNGFKWNGVSLNKVNFNEYESVFSCPTQALAARWLREAHNLHVYAVQTNLPYTEPQTTKWEWGYVIDKVDNPNGESICDMNYATYEEALEAGLQEAIKLL